MKKTSKRIIILIIILILIVAFLKIFRNSKAEDIIDIQLKVIDSEGIIDIQSMEMQATNEEKSGYSIILPEMVNGIGVNKYLVEIKSIDTKKETINEESNTVEQNELEQETEVETKAESEAEIEPEQKIETETKTEQKTETKTEQKTETKTESTITTEIKEMFPGERLYLTDEEKESKLLSFEIEYKTKQIGEKKFYYKNIKEKIETNANEKVINRQNIYAEGYMPLDTSFVVETLQESMEMADAIYEFGNVNSEIEAIFDIKLVSNDQNYIPKEYEEPINIAIEKSSESKKDDKYKIIKVEEDKETSKINAKEVENIIEIDNLLSFEVDELAIYAVLRDNAVEDTKEINISKSPAKGGAGPSRGVSAWDGTVATGFSRGNGTQSNPYLIASGSELAYLAQRVNAGNYYDGNYFQLMSDINLGGRTWTPIGNLTNSFRGILDGAGHTISNAVIQISSWSNTTITTYGIFGSIGNGTNRTIIRNVQFDDISVNITTGNTTSSNNTTAKGYHIGIVTGTMYRSSTIENVIVKNSTVEDTNVITLRTYSSQLAVGGIAGYATNSSSSNSDPGASYRYNISNCFSNVDINLDAAVYNTNSNSTALGSFHSGGIIGTIRGQAVWPTNCLFRGTIKTNGLIGPIFGGVMVNTTPSSRNNINNVWIGNDSNTLSMDSYYTNYMAATTSFTTSVRTNSDTVSRVSTNTRYNGYFQGVNKGIYTNNMNTMLTNFNNYVNTNNGLLSWKYENNTFSLIAPFDVELNDTNAPTYVVEVTDNYNSSNTYTYMWYVNGTLDNSITGNSSVFAISWTQDYDVTVYVTDGTYYGAIDFYVPQLELHFVFNYNQSSHTLTATTAGTGLTDPNYDPNDYTYKWYQMTIDGEETELSETSLTLHNHDDEFDYKLVGTNSEYSYMSIEGIFESPGRIVVFVDYNNGNDNNNGYTPSTAFRTLSKAYGEFSTSTSRNKNVIVVIGNYTSDTSFISSRNSTTYNKAVTITGKYAGTDYAANIRLTGDKFLTSDITFMYLTFNGNNSNCLLYCEGQDLTMGEQVTMTNYSALSSSYGTIGDYGRAFHVMGGIYDPSTSQINNDQNNNTIIIKSGTYGRIILGSRNNNSTTVFGSENNRYGCTLIVNIKNSTTNYNNSEYDINLIVSGKNTGSIYADITMTCSAGKIGRIVGGNLGRTTNATSTIPMNSYYGSTTMNLNGASITELYGASLGRQQANDVYYYGEIEINVNGSTISSSIYGGGAGGATGYSSTSNDRFKNNGLSFLTNNGLENSSAKITINSGTISGNIYGGGCGNSSSLTSYSSDMGNFYGTTEIYVNGGTITGSVYGAGEGYYRSGYTNVAQLTGSSYVEITGGTISGNIYGAGKGINDYTTIAKLIGSSTVKIASGLTIQVYGGGEISEVEGDTTVNIISGTHTGDIYGGGNEGIIDGTTTINITAGTNSKVFGGGNNAEVTGSATTIINGGTNTTVFGGGNNAEVQDTVVTINNGTNTTIYGGGNNADVDTTTVNVNGGTNTTVYGGGNEADAETTTVTITGGTITTVYGGGNDGEVGETTLTINGGQIQTAFGGGNHAEVEETNVTLSNGTVGTIYGGGNQADATTTNVDLTGGTATTVFGGGNQAGSDETNIICEGSTITTSVFGGSNQTGTVIESNIEVDSGTIPSVYGGNNAGGNTTTTNIEIVNGTITNLFGGGEQANSTTSYIIIQNGNITNVYGGGNRATLITTHVTVNNGDIDNLFGAGNQASATTTNVTSNGGTIDNIYGGGNQAGATTTNVTLNGGTIINSFGGSNVSGNVGTSYVTTSTTTSPTVTNIYGGNNQGGTTRNNKCYNK